MNGGYVLGVTLAVAASAYCEPAAALGGTFNQDGFRYIWTKQGVPSSARRIAACSYDGLYAQNFDGAIYVNNHSGHDPDWSYVTTKTNSKEIACYEDDLYSWTTDNKLWRWTGTTWQYITTLCCALHIQSGGSVLRSGDGYTGIWALNTDHSVWSSTDLPNNFWWQHGHASGAIRITGATVAPAIEGGYDNIPTRAFALNSDSRPALTGPIWYSPNILSSSPTWRQLNTGGLQPIEISAGASTFLYVLTNNYELWLATFHETNLSDGLDNDQDGFTDRLP